jgi:hypothetical protein
MADGQDAAREARRRAAERRARQAELADAEPGRPRMHVRRQDAAVDRDAERPLADRQRPHAAQVGREAARDAEHDARHAADRGGGLRVELALRDHEDARVELLDAGDAPPGDALELQRGGDAECRPPVVCQEIDHATSGRSRGDADSPPMR